MILCVNPRIAHRDYSWDESILRNFYYNGRNFITSILRTTAIPQTNWAQTMCRPGQLNDFWLVAEHLKNLEFLFEFLLQALISYFIFKYVPKLLQVISTKTRLRNVFIVQTSPVGLAHLALSSFFLMN